MSREATAGPGVLDWVDLPIADGRAGLVGRNAVGKSTLVRQLITLEIALR